MLQGLSRTVVGVDGCKGGWIAVSMAPGQKPVTNIHETFLKLVDAYPTDALICVDMPIGLPDTAIAGGRGAESAARTVLNLRKSSVFSIPSRSAVFLELGPLTPYELRKAARARTSAHARATSTPSTGVTFQAFSIFPKIREIDELLHADMTARSRVFESHPEVAFCILNDQEEMQHPKKSKAGMTERRALLARLGLGDEFVAQSPPAGSGADDFLDACAMLFIAGRITRGEARPFPDPSGRDSHGIPIAIWA